MIGYDMFTDFPSVLFFFLFFVFSLVFTATCFSNVAVMGSLDVRLSVCLSVCP